MAGENKEIELLNELIRATEEGRVNWRPTARVNEFTASFRGHFSALVSREDDDKCHLRIVDEDDRDLLHIVDHNPITQSDSPFVGNTIIQSVRRLYDLAYRNGLKVDKAIDEILQGLKSA